MNTKSDSLIPSLREKLINVSDYLAEIRGYCSELLELHEGKFNKELDLLLSSEASISNAQKLIKELVNEAE